MQNNRRSLMLGCPLDPSDAGCIHPGKIYAFGSYIPCSMVEHWHSSWSQMVLQVKRQDAWIIMNVGQVLAAHLSCWLDAVKHYVLTYVPGGCPRRPQAVRERDCTAKRLAVAIFEHLDLGDPMEIDDLLVQVHPKAKKQHRCADIKERERNVRGCYGVRPGAQVGGRTVILVDDVVTTGATMRECASALTHAGAVGVIGIAMARTIRSGSVPVVSQGEAILAS